MTGLLRVASRTPDQQIIIGSPQTVIRGEEYLAAVDAVEDKTNVNDKAKLSSCESHAPDSQPRYLTATL